MIVGLIPFQAECVVSANLLCEDGNAVDFLVQFIAEPYKRVVQLRNQ